MDYPNLDNHVLHRILSQCSVRDACACAAASKYLNHAVRAASTLWTTISFLNIVESIVDDCKALPTASDGLDYATLLSHQEAFRARRALESILGQHGRHCRRLIIPGCSEREAPEHMLCGMLSQRYLTNLEELDISHCHHLCVATACQVVLHSRKLRILRARGAGAIFCTAEEMRSIQSLPLAYQPRGVDALLSAVRAAGGGLSLELLDVKGMKISMTNAVDILSALVVCPAHGMRTQDSSEVAHGAPSSQLTPAQPAPVLRSLSQGWISEMDAATSGRPTTSSMYIGNLGPMLTWLTTNRMAENLVKLDMSGTWHVGNPSVVEPFFANLVSLRSLNLCCTPGLSGKALALLPTTNLQRLNLRSSDWLNDSCLKKLLKRTGRSLKELNLSCAESLTDKTWAVLPSLAPNLQMLDVCFCMSMSMDRLMEFMPRLPHITELGISGLQGTTDAALDRILGYYGRQLVMLGIGGCNELTNVSISNITARCHVLQSLYAAGLHRITNEAVESLLASRLVDPVTGTLKSISLDNCTSLDDALIQRVVQQWPYKYTGDTMPE